ncbi:MAG: DUF1616 domain-containing protein [Chloroflexi bacterium]|nr:DUF1616 domain-containing protein [Chloroflexota bacterium]
MVASLVVLVLVTYQVHLRVLQVLLGLPFVLFWPGYAVVSALFPRKRELPGIERLILGVGVSIALTSLLGLALNFTPWGVRLTPILVAIAAVVVVAGAGAYLRRLPAAPEERVNLVIPWPRLRGLVTTPLNLALIALVGFSLVAFGVVVGVKLTQPVGEPFSEFYLLGPKGKAEEYPQQLFAGQSALVVVGIVNRERKDMEYLIKGFADGEGEVPLAGPIALGPGERWEEPVRFQLARSAERIRYDFRLYKAGFNEPSSILYLWVNVRPGG